MVTKALLVWLEAKPGKGDTVQDFLVWARLLAEKGLGTKRAIRNTGTSNWTEPISVNTVLARVRYASWGCHRDDRFAVADAVLVGTRGFRPGR